eukprot:TRINITY_DN2431_c0_g1_i2.p1 TRINITY_DN2431_c0_g1~~TRINITY_DN2431_c0_g1_i2.p1  ORF type:complete len:281 (+),score=43.10 TRINITY_DN2431_c0_g1_i2:127-969(+)
MIAQNEKETLRSVLLSGLSGGCAGLFTDVMYFPIDSLKTRIQASIAGKNFVKDAKMVSKLKGISANFVVSFPAAFTFFTVYDGSKIALSNANIHPAYINLCSAAFGEIAQNIVRNPLEVCKQQMQIGLHKDIWETLRAVYRVKGFYAGYFSTVLRDVPFGAIQFPIYEFLKTTSRKLYHKKDDTKDSLPFWITSINGCIAASIAALVTTPLDVIKTRLMTQKSGYYKNVFDCASKIIREEGAKNLFKAWHIRVFCISSGGILFFTAVSYTHLTLPTIYSV